MPSDGFCIHYRFERAGEGPALRNTGEAAKGLIEEIEEKYEPVVG